VLKTSVGLVIVDWDFVRLAPPERDLWQLAETDRSVLAAYTEATGTAIDYGALALFRMWYDLSEIAGYIELFRAAHDDTEDTAESWKLAALPAASRTMAATAKLGCGQAVSKAVRHR
jgi:hypothetical protein